MTTPYPLVCAVPRTTPRPCRNTPTHVATRDHGSPEFAAALTGEAVGGEPPDTISEPACEDCAKALQRLTHARIEPLTDDWRARACADEWCEAGAFATEPGGTCPDCLERKADQERADDGPRFSDLSGGGTVDYSGEA